MHISPNLCSQCLAVSALRPRSPIKALYTQCAAHQQKGTYIFLMASIPLRTGDICLLFSVLPKRKESVGFISEFWREISGKAKNWSVRRNAWITPATSTTPWFRLRAVGLKVCMLVTRKLAAANVHSFLLHGRPPATDTERRRLRRWCCNVPVGHVEDRCHFPRLPGGKQAGPYPGGPPGCFRPPQFKIIWACPRTPLKRAWLRYWNPPPGWIFGYGPENPISV